MEKEEERLCILACGLRAPVTHIYCRLNVHDLKKIMVTEEPHMHLYIHEKKPKLESDSISILNSNSSFKEKL